MTVSGETRPARAKATAVSVEARPAPAKAMTVSRERFVMPAGYGGAWPGFETTRRAKLAARTARGRAAAHGRTKQPGPTSQAQRHPEHQRSRMQQAQSRIPAAVPVGGGGAWPGFETTRRAAEQRPGPTGVEGAGGSGGPGRGAGGWRQGQGGPRDRPLRAQLACGDLAGWPPPTGTHSGRAPKRHNGAPGIPAAPQATRDPGRAGHAAPRTPAAPQAPPEPR